MISRKVTNEKSFSLSRKRGKFDVDRFNIGMEKARSTKGRAKRKPRYKFIRGACLVGVGSDAARAANLFRRGKGTLRAREDEVAAAIKSFHYLNWVLLVGTCNQFFPPLWALLLLRILSSRPRHLSPKWMHFREKKWEIRGLLGAAAHRILRVISDSSYRCCSLFCARRLGCLSTFIGERLCCWTRGDILVCSSGDGYIRLME